MFQVVAGGDEGPSRPGLLVSVLCKGLSGAAVGALQGHCLSAQLESVDSAWSSPAPFQNCLQFLNLTLAPAGTLLFTEEPLLLALLS